jgi:NADH-quinone oxidoreductase subunit J
VSQNLLAAASTSTGEAVAFWVLSPVAVVAAVLILMSRKAVHSALWMALTMMVLAVLFVMQGAIFLGVVQVVVYTGAVMMLFLFVLMLVGVDASDSFIETLRAQRAAALLLALGFGGLVISGIGRAALPDAVGVGAANDAAGGHVEALAELIFTKFVFPFEVISAVLITAAVGAMVLTHRERIRPRKSQRELSVERVKGAHPTPRTSPGVYARHNAVDTPALLPDGSPVPTSVPRQLRRRGPLRGSANQGLPQDESSKPGGDS